MQEPRERPAAVFDGGAVRIFTPKPLLAAAAAGVDADDGEVTSRRVYDVSQRAEAAPEI